MTIRTHRYFRYLTYVPALGKVPIIKNYAPKVITMVIIMIFIIFAIKPTAEKIIVLQKKVSDANEILQKIEQKTADLSLAKKNYQNLTKDTKDKINQAITDTVAIQTIVSSLEQSARNNGASLSALQFQSFKVDQKREGILGEIGQIEFTFNVGGSYPQLVSILQELKTSRRLITIDSLSFRKTEGEDANLVVSITGKAYHMK